MAKLKLHYAGWLLLPATFRQALGLETNAVLEAELVDGTIVLRPAGEGRGAARAEPDAVEPPANAAPAVALLPDAPAKREPGRPRKVQAPELIEAVAAPRPRGRPRKALPEPAEIAAAPTSVTAPSELRRRAVLPTLVAELGTPQPEPAIQDPARVPEERRPFRQVEVRKLGPGRGHNRLHGLA